MDKAALNVLIVDDEPGDQMLEKLALDEQPFRCRTHSAGSVDEAIAHLNRCTSPIDGFRPDVVLLDGHLWEKTATDVIDHIKANPALRDIHVVVLTGSASKSEHARFLRHGADTVLEKTADFDDLIRTLSALERYAHAA